MTSRTTVRVAQLSDTHFLEPNGEAEGGFGYDTSQAFDAVYEHLNTLGQHDLVVVTGDIADHGRPAQYRAAADAFARFGAPVNVCPGNHDQDAAFANGLGRTTISTSRIIETDAWCFLFVDSNSGAMVTDETGRLVDPESYEDRLHGNGSLGEREASWIRQACATTEADHVFIWLHHPPAAPVGLTSNAVYADEWRRLFAELPNVRGMAAGHTHVPADYTFETRPVYVCPALKNNFDLDAKTLLPPGYRTYTFDDDGTVVSEVQLVDDERWPRHPLGRAVVSLLTGELTHAQFDTIVARKRAEAGT